MKIIDYVFSELVLNLHSEIFIKEYFYKIDHVIFFILIIKKNLVTLTYKSDNN